MEVATIIACGQRVPCNLERIFTSLRRRRVEAEIPSGSRHRSEHRWCLIKHYCRSENSKYGRIKWPRVCQEIGKILVVASMTFSPFPRSNFFPILCSFQENMAKIIGWSLNFAVGASTESTYALLGLIGNSRYDDVILLMTPGSGLRPGNNAHTKDFRKVEARKWNPRTYLARKGQQWNVYQYTFLSFINDYFVKINLSGVLRCRWSYFFNIFWRHMWTVSKVTISVDKA